MSLNGQTANHALQRTVAGHRGCHRHAPWPPSLSLGRWAAPMKTTRLLLLFMPLLLAGCMHERLLHVTGPYAESPLIKRSLLWWTSISSTNDTNHFYVGATKPAGGFVDAFVYWKEERTIIEYRELNPDLPAGREALAFHHWLKLDVDTVDTRDEIAGSNYVETHRTWVDWMEGCLSQGREYVITLDEARRLSPRRKIPDDN